MLALHDTASNRVTELILREPSRAGLYVCGPTVSGAPHIGHGRTTFVYDVLRRYLTFSGIEVTHVSNVTDIDDKIIARANAEGRPWSEVAAEFEEQWWAAMDAMGVATPTEVPHASEYLAQMVELIEQLVDAGAAYETGDGVYLATSKIPDYGLLVHQRLEDMQAGARVDVIEEKRSPADFALWKKAKPDEPYWPSPYGDGRPGWHTECVVMSLALLGDGFDVHGGGSDLIFPHHENERAQAVALGRRFAVNWVHSGLVNVDGQKMAKSVGNVTNLTDLLSQVDARAYRLLVLGAHYRSSLEVSADLLAGATNAVGRIDAWARRFADAPTSPPTAEALALRAVFVTEMDADLNTPGATAALFKALSRANSLIDGGDVHGGIALGRQVLELFAALGLVAVSGSVGLDRDVEDLILRRDNARAARDFALADQLRAELERRGFAVEDTTAGTRVHRA